MNDRRVAVNNEIPQSAVLAELEKVLTNEDFASSPRLSRFLRYVVVQTLEGNAAALKEYRLGQDVFDRGQDFDPRSDSVVRVEARQVRFKLAHYYAGPGANDEVVIGVPKGGYAASFEAARISRLDAPGLSRAITKNYRDGKDSTQEPSFKSTVGCGRCDAPGDRCGSLAKKPICRSAHRRRLDRRVCRSQI